MIYVIINDKEVLHGLKYLFGQEEYVTKDELNILYSIFDLFSTDRVGNFDLVQRKFLLRFCIEVQNRCNSKEKFSTSATMPFFTVSSSY